MLRAREFGPARRRKALMGLSGLCGASDMAANAPPERRGESLPGSRPAAGEAGSLAPALLRAASGVEGEACRNVGPRDRRES